MGVWVLLLSRLRRPTRPCLLCAFRALVGLRRLDIHNTSISGKAGALRSILARITIRCPPWVEERTGVGVVWHFCMLQRLCTQQTQLQQGCATDTGA